MFWIAMTVLVLLAVVLTKRRGSRYESVDEEPWRASLKADDDDGIDYDELRRAEEELLDEDEEPWR